MSLDFFTPNSYVYLTISNFGNFRKKLFQAFLLPLSNDHTSTFLLIYDAAEEWKEDCRRWGNGIYILLLTLSF